MIRSMMKVCALALIPFCVTPALAAKKGGGGKGKLTPEEMTALWAKAAAPGEHHKMLEAMVGKFNATVKHWVDPTGEPTVTKATSETSMILGGRYLEQKYKGDFRGTPIEGLGLVGYDNVGQKYMAIWVDSASTDVLVTEGTADKDHKVISQSGKFFDVVSGKQGKLRTVITLADADTIKYELYKTRNGREGKVLDVEYKRVK